MYIYIYIHMWNDLKSCDIPTFEDELTWTSQNLNSHEPPRMFHPDVSPRATPGDVGDGAGHGTAGLHSRGELQGTVEFTKRWGWRSMTSGIPENGESLLGFQRIWCGFQLGKAESEWFLTWFKPQIIGIRCKFRQEHLRMDEGVVFTTFYNPFYNPFLMVMTWGWFMTCALSIGLPDVFRKSRPSDSKDWWIDG